VTVAVEGYERTAGLLTATLGLRDMGAKGNRFRYTVGEGHGQGFVDLLCLPSGPRGRVAVGTVHHIAWRTPDDEAQRAWRETISRLGYNVTPIIDRTYFHSIYFREPGGVLFEIATDPPGFTLDEPAAKLGTRLVLPSWLEATRGDLATALPALRGPQGQRFP
jgi:catechol 2,3-dioxygenase-like lactoylglutathione lyase family enzyme